MYGTLPLSTEDEQFQQEVRDFLAANLPTGWGTSDYRRPRGEAEQLEFQRDWQRRLFHARLAAIAWPKAFGGRDAGFLQQLIFNTEMALHHAPDPLNRGAIAHIGPTLIQSGSPAQQERFLPGMLSGDEIWCQGFSEPGAGSDLAALRTRAVPDGDGFLVSGQKIWTSKAQVANWCLLLARTDPAAEKTKGISCLIVDMTLPGITVRPIRQITGQSEFNEVFLDEVRVDRTALVGAMNEGWRVATSTLRYERAGLARPTRVERRLKIVTKLAQENMVDGRPCIEDAVVRDRLAGFVCRVEALRQIATTVSAASLRGVSPGPAASFAKLLISETDQEMSEFGMDLSGPYAALVKGSPHAIKGGNVPQSYLIMRAATIGGGTSEVQRNIVGERVLGLPKG